VDPKVLHNLSYGMYIVSSCKNGALNGQIANTVFQITSEPVTVAVSLNKKNLTHEFVEASGRFTVSVLDEKAPLPFIGKFGFKSGRNEDKFKDVKYKLLTSGCPVVLENTICYLEAKVTSKFDCGTHTLFLGEMTGSGFIAEGKPMTYGYYHFVKKGTTPPSAPTFIRGEQKK
jgi:ferric-chelate reductase [NAD(P)H]